MTRYGYLDSSISPVHRSNSSGKCLGGAALILTWALVAGCVEDPRTQQKTVPPDGFQTARGTALELPAEGDPRYNRETADLARQIKEIDAALEDWRRSSGKADPQVAQEAIRVMTEARDAAVEDLALAYRISKITSGLLDDRLVSGARDSLNFLLTSAKAPAGSLKLEVRTVITSAGSVWIQWVPAADFGMSASPNWQPYTEGQLLHAGVYTFRVQPSDRSRQAFIKKNLTVLTDPFSCELSE